MKVVTPTDSEILELMTWFDSEQTLSEWSGPGFRYPFNLQTFKADLQLNELQCCALVDDNNELLAFGQYYLRLGRCHLARLVVSPLQRGKGLAKSLMLELCKRGLQSLKVRESSLFVYEYNQSAIKAYEKFGFVITPYPEEMALDGCVYMVKSL
ncbi:hypothetical protein PSECIP111951_02422 [Pseudoalteromonas holothuriae]|uniref:N-acetyltransferase domain-containing protein n=1 Tax=Pseudoalteromonas holothuriae TaxID=2963714 RepID=A0A9W4VNK0_9GAMM|nr:MULTISPECIES: GNAT family N-acetyltransferase [unclassified Pseudoalteromonas]CAH9053703.1 hypothetical protein PSECIP111854_01222 [Pseudoalteromonas sp. CIP111854]CAH9061126.1 hypothetical protein PSECIP111951_02422 [Pseudoalteromonas sp. CIP111951]